MVEHFASITAFLQSFIVEVNRVGFPSSHVEDLSHSQWFSHVKVDLDSDEGLCYRLGRVEGEDFHFSKHLCKRHQSRVGVVVLWNLTHLNPKGYVPK